MDRVPDNSDKRLQQGNNKRTTKLLTNSEKVRICRVLLLVPMASIILVVFLMLFCMKMVPDMLKTHDDPCILYVNCSRTNESANYNQTPCSIFRKFNQFHSQNTPSECYTIVASFTTDSSGRLQVTDKQCNLRLCFNNNNGFANFTRRIRHKNGTFQCVLSTRYEQNNNCTEESEGEMERNTKTTVVVFSVLLPIALVAVLIMCVFTTRVMKVCCHLCYDE